MTQGHSSRNPSGGLASTAWLEDHLGDEGLRIYDTTVHLRRSSSAPGYEIISGRDGYEEAHVPGAGFLDLTADLSDRSSSLRFMMPSPEQMETALSEAGIDATSRVVLYSATSPMWATRVWWMLRSCGFDGAMVLDGGLAKWRSEGRALCAEPCGYPSATFRAEPRPRLWADRDEVLAAVGDGDVCTLNALSRDVHSGSSPVHYGRPGHIRGSRNVPWEELLAADQQSFREPDELRTAFEAVGAFARPRVLTYCGGGIAATLDAFVLTMLGHPDVAVYDGSLSDWAPDASLPMEVGD